MIEIIFYGRGGQGAVTAAQILATAAFREGKYSHALPYFRAERKGAPVIAYTRISDEPMEVRGSVEKADIILILDGALLKAINPLGSLKSGGLAIINTTRTPEEIMNLATNKDIKVDTIDATALSEKIYGQASIPRVNVAMLGHFVASTKSIKVESVLSAVDDYFYGENATKAKEGVKLAYNIATENKEKRVKV
jgi:2-oxoisovalerate ferredoxin oxidoreductase gamma subunit